MKPEFVFCVLALAFGVMMLIFNLPFRSHDELVHFFRSYSISEGNLICDLTTRNESPGGFSLGLNPATTDQDSKGKSVVESKWVGNEIPFSVLTTARRTVLIDWLPVDPQRLSSAMNIPNRSSPRVFIDYSLWASIATYSPLGYLPQSFGIALGRTFSLSPLLLLYVARFFNLIVFVILVFFAIRITPVLKWTMVLLGLMPLVINVAASVSSDALAIGLAFLFSAYLFRLALSPEIELISRKQLGFILLLALLLALSKPPYFLLVFLFLLIPTRKLASRREYAVAFAAIMGAVLAVVFVWNFTAKSAYVPRLETVAPLSQLAYIIKNPARYGWILLRTAYAYKWLWPKTFVGGISFIEGNLPLVFLILYIIAIPTTAFFEPADRTPNLREKGVAAGTFIVIAAVLLSVFYITWTPVGGRLVEGFQAKYLLPIAPLVFLLLTNAKFKIKREWLLPVAVWSFSCISIAVTMFYVIRTFF